MIPTTKIVVTGNLEIGRNLIGYAKEELATLKRQMQLARPKPLNEGYRTIKPFPGVVIEAYASFRLQAVRIHVDLEGGPIPPPEREKEKSKECPCFPHFSVARVTGVTPEEPIKGVDPDTGESFAETEAEYRSRQDAYTDHLYNSKFVYDLEICSKTYYVLFEGALDANFGRYYVGEVVLVSIGDEMDGSLDCDRTCLLSLPRFETLAVVALHAEGVMRKWIRRKEYYVDN